MSAQFGRWTFDGAPPDPDCFKKAENLLAPYGPDERNSYSAPGIDVLYRAFHTTTEARREKQPYRAASGAIIVWDGRLDNRLSLLGELGGSSETDDTDVSVVAAAFDRWRYRSFAKLVGDWAMSVWQPAEKTLLLAKDSFGTKPLFYVADPQRVTWSSTLDPLVLLSGRRFEVDEEYLAGWLAFFPAAHLTPYVGIHSVPPSCYVVLKPGTLEIRKYWDFDPSKRIRYRLDTEYEEHFRTAFRQSVGRRLRSDSPVLAELSGGMDSSSIVCVADELIAQSKADTTRLDTLSYYDDSEPNWNEKPFFETVERKRGKTGLHIHAALETYIPANHNPDRYACTPAELFGRQESRRLLREALGAHGYRVLLSGVGGDEVLGGVPTPAPEIADLLVQGRLRELARQLVAWALSTRRPILSLFLEAASAFLPFQSVSKKLHQWPPSWMVAAFAKRHRTAVQGYLRRLALFGPLPSLQENLHALGGLERQIACTFSSPDVVLEKRYPFLDRDLLEFLYAIPREQLVRPGRRRSLMRRALAGIVPAEVLDRKRNAFVARGPMVALAKESSSLLGIATSLVSASFRIVSPHGFRKALEDVRAGRDIPTVAMMRTLALEFWLCNATPVLQMPAVVREVSPLFAQTSKDGLGDAS